MEKDGNGRYAFRNVKTGHYFSYTSGTGNGSTQNASATKKSYYTVSETDEAWQRTYHISGSDTGTPYFTHTIPSNAPTGTPALRREYGRERAFITLGVRQDGTLGRGD